MASDDEESETLREVVAGCPAVLYRLELTDEGRFRIAFIGENLRSVVGYQTRVALRDPAWWQDRVHTDDLRSLAENGPDFRVPGHHVAMYRFRHASGEWIWLHDEAITRPASARDVVAEVTGFFLDITERQRIEEAARAAEERLHSLLDNMPVVISVVDRDGILVALQGKGVEAGGVPADELVGKPVAPLLDQMRMVEEDGSESSVADLHARALAGETVRLTLRLNDGYFDARVAPLRDRFGRVVGAGTTAVAVTERELAYRELRASRQRLEALSLQLIAAQEEERRRLARELHDEIGQDLTALKLDLAALSRADDGLRHAAPLADALTIAGRLLDRVRAMSLELHPSMLDDLGLVAALRWYVEGHAQRTGLRAEVTIDPPDLTVGREPAIVAYRIGQEAITNVVRHAEAMRIEVALVGRGGRLQLTVRDDGRGFTPAAAPARPAGGLGLVGMAERAALAGGRLTIVAAPGQGTVIALDLPLAPAS